MAVGSARVGMRAMVWLMVTGVSTASFAEVLAAPVARTAPGSPSGAIRESGIDPKSGIGCYAALEKARDPETGPELNYPAGTVAVAGKRRVGKTERGGAYFFRGDETLFYPDVTPDLNGDFMEFYGARPEDMIQTQLSAASGTKPERAEGPGSRGALAERLRSVLTRLGEAAVSARAGAAARAASGSGGDPSPGDVDSASGPVTRARSARSPSLEADLAGLASFGKPLSESARTGQAATATDPVDPNGARSARIAVENSRLLEAVDQGFAAMKAGAPAAGDEYAAKLRPVALLPALDTCARVADEARVSDLARRYAEALRARGMGANPAADTPTAGPADARGNAEPGR